MFLDKVWLTWKNEKAKKQEKYESWTFFRGKYICLFLIHKAKFFLSSHWTICLIHQDKDQSSESEPQGQENLLLILAQITCVTLGESHHCPGSSPKTKN